MGRNLVVVVREDHRGNKDFAAAYANDTEVIENVAAVDLEPGINACLGRSGATLGEDGADQGGPLVAVEVFDVPNGAATGEAGDRDQH